MEGKTYSAGTVSPNVRANFAIRFLRISTSDNLGGNSGVIGVTGCVGAATKGDIGERGMRESEGDAGTVLTRK